MTDNSLEFQPMPGIDSGEDKVRNSFRVPASDKDNVLAVFYQKTFTVVNISSIGIAIRADSCLEFEAGQIIEDAELVLGSQRMEGLTAKVVHCSVHDTGDLQFGLAWVNMTAEEKERIDGVIERIKARFLSKE
ncbi:MAG: PilZ domain-containing protein [Desulfobacter sp.]|nr:MAG: PilZ domain-containing protein [Desulfobacter sp.]